MQDTIYNIAGYYYSKEVNRKLVIENILILNLKTN